MNKELNSIAQFYRIVKNYMKMKRLEKDSLIKEGEEMHCGCIYPKIDGNPDTHKR